MNTKRLLDKVLDKWPAKVVCLIIAIFLYFFHQASLIESKTFVVPLQIIENGIVMHIGNAPKSISVVVRAEEEAIKSVLATDLTATVCLDDITKKGIYKLPVKITLADSLLEYDPFEVKIKDDTVTIEVDRKAIKYVPLIPSVIGEVASGYEIDTIIMNPSTIEIIGPESVLNATEQIYTTRVNVSNAENNFSTETSYQQLNKLLTVVDEGPFKAEVFLKPKIIEKDYNQIKIEALYLDSSLEIAEPLPLVSLKLSGAMPILENYILSKHAVQLNLYDIKDEGTYEIPLKYNIPANLQLTEKSDDEITLTIVRKPGEEAPDEEEGEAN